MALAGSLHVGFGRISTHANGGTLITSVTLEADLGPDSVRVDWGNADPEGLAPQAETYLPGEDAVIAMPGRSTGRGYLDGDYLVKVRASSSGGSLEKASDGSSTDSVVLTAFIDAGGTIGIARTGDTRDNLMVGGSGGDSFSGTRGDDWLVGGAGNDSLDGGDDHDVLEGGDGDDAANGGKGDDVLTGGAGADTLIGDAGADILLGGDGNDSVDGGANDDEIRGDGDGAGDDVLNGGTGNDTILGEAGDDSLIGGSDSDSLVGGTGRDSLSGGADDDWLAGNDGNDRISAGAGSDTVIGGLGRDVIAASADGTADLFLFESIAEGGDRISGFEQGLDRIGLLFLAEPDAAHVVGSTAAMVDTAAHVIYDAGAGTLSVDLDGTGIGAAVLMVTLAGKPALTFGDLLFVGSA